MPITKSSEYADLKSLCAWKAKFVADRYWQLTAAAVTAACEATAETEVR